MSEHDHAHHVVPTRTYYAVFAALLVLTVVTVYAARFDLGHPEVFGVQLPLNVMVALLIAFTKATLVVLFFMHVKYSSRLVWLALAGALVFLLIMFGITATDYVSRGWLGYPGT